MTKHFGNARLTFDDPQAEEELARTTSTTVGCEVVSVGKRRDGGTRYWCMRHKADATAKYGKPAISCRASQSVVPPLEETYSLNLDEYPGGVALWGAVPPVYDTTRFPMERGIHVHARKIVGGPKDMDRSFSSLRLLSGRLPDSGVVISEIDAIYYMATSVFGYQMRHVCCTYCGHSHLDKDFFSVHPHRRHLCASCGRHFQDTTRGIGNPICAIREICGVDTKAPVGVERPLDIRQEDFRGGLQIWGTNPALLWTGEKPEEEGIHVHAFTAESTRPVVDETFSAVRIDGIELDPAMVRTLMAQSALPSLNGRVLTHCCLDCGQAHHDLQEDAFTPRSEKICAGCSVPLHPKGRYRKTVSNPLVTQLDQLSAKAVRAPQIHDLGLAPETL